MYGTEAGHLIREAIRSRAGAHIKHAYKPHPRLSWPNVSCGACNRAGIECATSRSGWWVRRRWRWWSNNTRARRCRVCFKATAVLRSCSCDRVPAADIAVPRHALTGRVCTRMGVVAKNGAVTAHKTVRVPRARASLAVRGAVHQLSDDDAARRGTAGAAAR